MKTKNYLLIIFVIILLTSFIIFSLFKDTLTVELILHYYDSIKLFIEKNFINSVILFIFLYSFLILLNFPIVSLLSMASGLFFGTILGGFLVSIAATIGSFLFFLIAKYFFHDFFKKKVLTYLSKFDNYFKKNELGFLLLFRLSGLPFFIQNLVISFLGVNQIKFILTTFFGIMPYTFIFTNIGSNIDEIINNGEEIGMHLLIKPQYILPIMLLGFLTILGMILKNRLKL